MSTQAVATQQNRSVTRNLRSILDEPATKARIAQILRDGAPEFSASLIQVAQSSEALMKCEPNSIIAAGITAAALRLAINKDLGRAHIVPYGGRAQFQIGYLGLVELAQRTGQYKRMNAVCVNDGAFGGYDDVGEPIIDWEKIDETKPAIGYAFAFIMLNGFTKVVYWTKAKVEAHAKRYSKAYSSGYDSPWKSNFDAMAKKTVIKDGLRHWGLLSIEMQKAITLDQTVKADIDSDPVYPDNSPNLAPERAKIGEGAIEAEATVVTPPAEPEKKVEEAKPEPKQEEPVKKNKGGRPPGSKNKTAKDFLGEDEPEKTPEPKPEPPTHSEPENTHEEEEEGRRSNPAPEPAEDDVVGQLRKRCDENMIPEGKLLKWMEARFHIQPHKNLDDAYEAHQARVFGVLAKWDELYPDIEKGTK